MKHSTAVCIVRWEESRICMQSRSVKTEVQSLWKVNRSESRKAAAALEATPWSLSISLDSLEMRYVAIIIPQTSGKKDVFRKVLWTALNPGKIHALPKRWNTSNLNSKRPLIISCKLDLIPDSVSTYGVITFRRLLS